MVWKVLTPPDDEPVTLIEAKAHLRIDEDNLDESIIFQIESARQFVELTCNRALMDQTWEVTLPSFGSGYIPLPGGNVSAIDSIQYYDTDNVQQTLASSEYYPRLEEPARVEPRLTWPATFCRPDAVLITLSVGHEQAADVPAPLRSAVLLQTELLIERPIGPEREALESARDTLLFPYIDGRMLT